MKNLILLVFVIFAFDSFSQQVPVGRATAHLFYVPSLGTPVLIDGYEKNDDSPDKAEVWELRNNQWIKINSGDYEARKLTAAAVNSDKSEIFTFGGVGKNGYDFKKSDGFIFDLKKWRRIEANDIGSRDHHEMTYDRNLKAYVMYGGVDGAREYDTSTWIFRDERWNRLNIPGPGKRVHHAMVYDVSRQVVVLYGGSGSDHQYADTWEFDGAKWRQMSETGAPGTMLRHTMIYDPVRKVVLLHGGSNLWGWNGATWSLVSKDAPDRMFSAMCFDEKRNVVVLFGGVDGAMRSDTWEWDGKSWKQILNGKSWKWNDAANKYLAIDN